MRTSASPKLAVYMLLTGLGLLGALVLGRPELVVVALPFAVIVAVGAFTAGEPGLTVRSKLSADRLVEGGDAELQIDLYATHGSSRVDFLLRLPPGLEVVDGDNPCTIRIPREQERTLRFRIRGEHWGGYVVGDVLVRASDPLGLFRFDAVGAGSASLRVFPRQEHLRRLVHAYETQPFVGDELARRRGDGIEFADMRPFTVGDPVRQVNWRATARRGELWVNDRHPERSSDVVIFLDALAQAGNDRSSTLDQALRAATSIARSYAGRRDRVGLVSFGGMLRWLQPGGGIGQFHRIVDALLDTEIRLETAWDDVDIVPPRVLPPDALVIAITPLLDERSVNALLNLRSRGFDLAVIETSPEPFVEPGDNETLRLGFRIWQLARDALRTRYRRAGVAVAEWHDGDPLTVPIEEVNEFRRHALIARV